VAYDLAMADYDTGSLSERVARLVQDWERVNAELAEEGDEPYTVETVAVVYGLIWPDGRVSASFSCSDPRPPAQADLFRRAAYQAELGGHRDPS